MKIILSALAVLMLASSAHASDIKIYGKQKDAVEKVSERHGIALSRAEHKRRKSKKWGRAKEHITHKSGLSHSLHKSNTTKVMSGHSKKKSPKKDRVKF